MSTTVRLAEASDRAALLRLFADVFGEADPAALWAWKYDQNPHRGASIAAMEGDRAVGYFGILATRYRGASMDAPGGSAVDVMTSPSSRRLGRGLYREMVASFVLENRARGVPFVFGFPNERHRLIGERLGDYRVVEPAGRWIRPVSTPGLLRRLRRRLVRVRSESDFSPGHDDLAEVLHARPGLRTDRSRRVLEWRYGRHPRNAYRRFELLGPRGESKAYAVVLQVFERSLLVDLQARDESDGSLRDLLDVVAEECRSSGGARLEIRAARATGLGPLLPGLGFVEERPEVNLSVMAVAEGFPVVETGRGLDYRLSDHDIF